MRNLHPVLVWIQRHTMPHTPTKVLCEKDYYTYLFEVSEMSRAVSRSSTTAWESKESIQGWGFCCGQGWAWVRTPIERQEIGWFESPASAEGKHLGFLISLPRCGAQEEANVRSKSCLESIIKIEFNSYYK